MRHNRKLRAVSRAARYLWWALALAAHEAGGATIPYVNHHDAHGTAGLEVWEEGDSAGWESVADLMDELREAEVLDWSDEAKVITLLLSLPLLGEEEDAAPNPAAPVAASSAEPAGAVIAAGSGAARPTRPPAQPGAASVRASVRAGSRTPRERRGPASKALINAKFYFKKRRDLCWKDVPAEVSFEAWLATAPGQAWLVGRGFTDADVAATFGPAATGPAIDGASAIGLQSAAAIDCNGSAIGSQSIAKSPSPGPSPSEKTAEEKQKESETPTRGPDLQSIAKPAIAIASDPIAKPAIVSARPSAIRSNPIEILADASRGVVRAMGGAASLITGPGEFRDQLAELFVGDDELRAWGADLATEEGRKASWPDRSWTAGDLKVIGPIVTGRRSITLDWLRKASFNGRPWEFLRNGIEDWRKSRADRAAARASTERPAAGEVPGGREDRAPGAQRLPSDRVAALAGQVLKQGFKAQRSVGR